MANTVRISTQVTGVKGAENDLERLHGKFERLQKQGAKGFAIGAGAAVTAKGLSLLEGAASAAFNEVGQMTQRASDLNESVSKSNVVFGDASTSVERFGDKSADAFGISKQAAIEASASFGNVFRGLDIGEQKAADMSIRMVALAGDLASFNNVGTDVALEKIRAGLAGEAEPLRAFGVLLNEAAVKAEAMRLGLADANGEVSDGAKVQARYSLILKQTTRAQGDAARTGDEAAGVNRRLQASVEDLEAAIGQKLLPVQRDFTKLLLEEGIPAVENEAAGIEKLIAGVERLAQKARPAADGIAFMTAEMADNIAMLGDLITFWDGFASKAERNAARAAEAVAEAMEFMADASKDDTAIVGEAFDKLGDKAGDMGDAVKDGAAKAAESIEDMRDRIAGAAKDTVNDG